MNEQLALFDILDEPLEYRYTKRYHGYRKVWKTQHVDVYEGDVCILHVWCTSQAPHPPDSALLEQARLAILLWASRPLGDEYETPVGRVTYLWHR